MSVKIADWLKAIIVVVMIVVAWYFVSAIRTTVIIFSVATVIAFLLAPIVNFLVSKNSIRIVAILVVYAGFLLLFGTALFLLIPFVLEQAISFLDLIPTYIDEIIDLGDRMLIYIKDTRYYEYFGQIPFNMDVLISQASNFATNQIRSIIGFIPSIIGLISELILAIIISSYLLFYFPQLDKEIRKRLPEQTKGLYLRFLQTTKVNLQRYMLGQLTLMIIVGALTGVAVWLLGLPYALLLGIWAGLTEAIPYLGPILGAIPAILIALTVKPIYVLWVVLIYAAIQQLESTFLSPVILGESIGVNPIIIAFAIIAGAEIAGVIGALLAVPVLVILRILIRFFLDNYKYLRNESGPDELTIR